MTCDIPIQVFLNVYLIMHPSEPSAQESMADFTASRLLNLPDEVPIVPSGDIAIAPKFLSTYRSLSVPYLSLRHFGV